VKLVFNTSNISGMALAYVECVSLGEADEFLTWFSSRTSVASATPLAVEVVEEKQPEPEPAPKPAAKPKHSKADVSQAAIALVQTKGRPALEPILARYNAKRISDLRAEDLDAVMDDIQGAK
jgi:hypothetical protein